MNLNEVQELITNAGAILDIIDKEGEKEEYISLLRDVAGTVNQMLYRVRVPENSEGAEICEMVKKQIPVWNESARFRIEEPELDARFYELYEYFRMASFEDLRSNMIAEFGKKSPEDQADFSARLQKMVFLDGTIDPVNGDFSLIDIYAAMIKEHTEDFLWLYKRLGDNRSRQVLVRIAEFWTNFNEQLLDESRETMFQDYYDLDLVEPREGDVFVDCGAFVGDSIVGYIKAYGSIYKRIYTYEMVDKIYQLLMQVTGRFRDIVYRKVGVSDKYGEMYLAHEEYDDAASLSEQGDTRVEIVPLDEDIKEPVSTIKMDIEGAEMDALAGAKNHIVNEKPRLLISAYHKPEHIFEIPKRICEYREDYKIYLRNNGKVVWPADFILIAI